MPLLSTQLLDLRSSVRNIVHPSPGLGLIQHGEAEEVQNRDSELETEQHRPPEESRAHTPHLLCQAKSIPCTAGRHALTTVTLRSEPRLLLPGRAR